MARRGATCGSSGHRPGGGRGLRLDDRVTGELGGAQPEQKAWTAVGAIILFVSAFAVTHLLVTGTAPFPVAAGVAIGLAAALHGLERALNPQVMNADDAEWVLVIRLLPALLLAAAPCLARLGAVRPALSRRSASFVAPLVALGTTQALLIAQLSDEGLNARSWGTAMGTVIIAGLIILRQDGLLVENARLVGRLDQTVDTVGRRERWFRSLVEHASDITLVLDRHGVITYATPALRSMLGQDPSAAVGQPGPRCFGLSIAGGSTRCSRRSRPPRMVNATDELEVRRADGAGRWLEVIATGRLDDPAVAGVVLNVRDVSDTVALRERLWHDASHDPLTGLANARCSTSARRRCATPTPAAGAARCCCSTSTSSRTSTTSSATGPATSCCASRRGGSSTACARRTRSPGSAATSSA